RAVAEVSAYEHAAPGRHGVQIALRGRGQRGPHQLGELRPIGDRDETSRHGPPGEPDPAHERVPAALERNALDGNRTAADANSHRLHVVAPFEAVPGRPAPEAGDVPGEEGAAGLDV